MRLRTCCATLLVLGVPAVASAQRSAARVRVNGTAYDSLRGRPLAGARISVGLRSTVADEKGRFAFDSVTPGPHTFAVQHAELDSAGFFGLSSKAVIGENGGEVHIATPSFATLWRLVCRRPPPKDSSLVYGTIRDSQGDDPAASVNVRVTWLDWFRNGKRSLGRRLWAAETRSDYAGTYVVCGVPNAEAVRVQATSPLGASGGIIIHPSGTRVYRRDLVIGPPSTDSAHLALITGLVTGPDGEPVVDARIVVNDELEVRSAFDGSFTMRHVPAGTQQVAVFAIGMKPETRAIDLAPGDTHTVAIRMSPIRTLGARRVTATRGKILIDEFNDRRKSGLGYVMDSTTIASAPQFLNALAVVPSLSMYLDGSNVTLAVPGSRGGQCAPELRIDGVLAGYNHLRDLVPRDIAGVEVYVHGLSVPPRYMTDRSKAPCGVVLVWTKYAFRVR